MMAILDDVYYTGAVSCSVRCKLEIPGRPVTWIPLHSVQPRGGLTTLAIPALQPRERPTHELGIRRPVRRVGHCGRRLCLDVRTSQGGRGSRRDRRVQRNCSHRWACSRSDGDELGGRRKEHRLLHAAGPYHDRRRGLRAGGREDPARLRRERAQPQGRVFPAEAGSRTPHLLRSVQTGRSTSSS